MFNPESCKLGNWINAKSAMALCVLVINVSGSVLAAGGKNQTWLSCDISFESRNSPGKSNKGVNFFVIDKSKPDVYVYDSKLLTVTSVTEPSFGQYCDGKTDAVRVSESKIIWNSFYKCKNGTTATESYVIDRASLKYQALNNGSDGDWARWDGVCEIIQPKVVQGNRF